MAARKRERRAEDEVSRLYSLPLDDFVAERDELARRLREDGDREAAAEVRKLRKPNLPAWAINQGVRGDPAAAQNLVEAGERLAGAQAAALEGKGRDELREAMRGQQDAIERMIGAVEAGLGDAGRGGAILDRARETLRALAGDDELRARFAAGRLDRDREAVGFGAGAGPVEVKRRGRASPRKAGAGAARRRQAEQKAERASRSLGTAARKVSEARARLERAQAATDAARERLDQAERERAERERELADANAVVEELRES